MSAVAFSPMQLALHVEPDSAPALTGWHAGEKELQKRIGAEDALREDWKFVYKSLPMQHRLFFTELDFLPLTTLDSQWRPWVSLLVGPSGQPGFISSPNDSTLQLVSITWDGDPIRDNLSNQTDPNQGVAVAGVGVMVQNRRRNKVAGTTKQVGFMDNFMALQIGVTQALGNCPKYIPIRHLEPYPNAMPTLDRRDDDMFDHDVLPAHMIDFVLSRDMLYLGSTHEWHLGCNIRAGAPGFVRVMSDQKTLVIPDYSGNRRMSSLGNIWETKKAGLVFPDFENGDVLYLTGDAEILFDDEAKAVMPRVGRLLKVRLTGYSFVRNALPFRTVPGSYEASPYTPPIRYLQEENKIETVQDTTAMLTDATLHSPDLATLTFELSKPVKHVSGQYGIFDMSGMLGEIGYAHMKQGDEKYVNEDGIRTWTISSAPSDPSAGQSTTVELTIRRVYRGRVTSSLFSYIERRTALAPSDLEDESKRFGLNLPFLGTAGSFTLPSTPSKLLLISGGVGITPYLSMLSSFTDGDKARKDGWDIVLWSASRDPEQIAQLIDARAKSAPLTSYELFSSSSPAAADGKVRRQRMTDWIVSPAFEDEAKKIELHARHVYICGPPQFESAVLEELQRRGVNTTDVKRESFSF